MGGSDGVLKGGSERGWKRAPIGRSCVLSRSRYSGDGHAWLWGGGGSILEGNPPGYGPDIIMLSFPNSFAIKFKICARVGSYTYMSWCCVRIYKTTCLPRLVIHQ